MICNESKEANRWQKLVNATAAYRGALTTLSHASAALARSLETCSRLKGVSDESALGFQAAGGLHHLIANHEQVLVRHLWRFLRDDISLTS